MDVESHLSPSYEIAYSIRLIIVISCPPNDKNERKSRYPFRSGKDLDLLFYDTYGTEISECINPKCFALNAEFVLFEFRVLHTVKILLNGSDLVIIH